MRIEADVFAVVAVVVGIVSVVAIIYGRHFWFKASRDSTEVGTEELNED
jgi:hypothetical protein